MEVLERYGTEAQKARWLPGLMAGEARSAYLMTEPDVASSDATQISLKCERDGEHYVLKRREILGNRRGRSALQPLYPDGLL